MWEPAISGMGNAHNCASKLQAYPPIFSLTPKASGSTRLQSCEDKVFNSQCTETGTQIQDGFSKVLRIIFEKRKEYAGFSGDRDGTFG